MRALLKIINVLPEAVILLRGDGTLVASNLAARDLFGDGLENGVPLSAIVKNSPEEIVRALNLWSGSSQFLPTALRILRDGQPVMIRCDGAAIEPGTRESPSLLILRCLPKDQSATTKFITQLNEKVENLRKQLAEQRIHDKDRLSSLATAAAVFAHEVANPLNGISISLQLLEREVLDRQIGSPLLQESIIEANKEISRLSSLLRDFRSFARTQSFEFQLTDLSKLVQEVLAPEMVLFTTSGVQVISDLQGLPLIMIDPDKMKQAVLNLCKNAVEAMPQGGCLTIKGHRFDAKTVLVEVADTGIGLPEGVNVFEIFRTTKPDGSGLGLPLVAQIIAGHKGSIDYSSESGKGTTFRISLPINSNNDFQP